ncbi:MAG: hypothetical protein JOZ75_12445 [Candidatus Dormibacteraeota bacterium]|nr:hypothetical protein [Candidatus Dormibacteraeota bacterium]
MAQGLNGGCALRRRAQHASSSWPMPFLRKTALIGIGICLVALTIAIVKTTLVNNAINY